MKEELQDGPIVSIERREGSLTYLDDAETKGERCPLLGSLTVAVLIREGGATQILFRALGPPSTIAEGMALYLMHNPGMFEAMQGMLALHMARRAQGR